MIKRLFRIIQANVEYQTRKSREPSKGDRFSSNNHQKATDEDFSSEKPINSNSSTEQQLIDDLAHFGLKLPSSLKEVTAARNREMLKFHPDKFALDYEKSRVANEIALIYNAAFERLKKYYTK